jgi:hypothetical protein
MTKKTCDWCRAEFEPRADGGHVQRFCKPSCRRACDAAGRRWVTEAIAAGSIHVDAVRSGDVGKRVVPTSNDVVAAELLRALLSVNSEGWKTIAAAMTDDLFDGLKRWQASVKKQRR